MATPTEGRLGKAVGLSELTAHLVCPLCGGYYIDATAIVECLHTFCRSCILRHLETSSYCPVLTCDVMIHRTKGAVSLRPDATLQSIVYKTVPGLHRDEMRRRQLFYADKPEADSELAPAPKGCYEEGAGRYYASDDTIDVRIQYASHNPEEVVPVRYLRCPAGLPLLVLKKFLFQKYGFPDSLQMELIHGRKVLPLDIKLLDVAYIINWSRKSALKLLFRMSNPKVTIKRKIGTIEAMPSSVEPPEKTRKVIGEASVPSCSADITPSPAGGSDGKSDGAKSITKAKSSAPPPTPDVRISPPSPAEPQSPRAAGPPASSAAKSGERSGTQLAASPAVTSQKTGHQPPVSTVAPAPRADKLPKLEKPPQNVVSKQKTQRPEPIQRTNSVSKSHTNEPSQAVKPQVKSSTVRLNQVLIKAGHRVQKSIPQPPSDSTGQKPAPRPPGTQLGHSYLACKMAMKLAASAVNSKTVSNVRSVSVGSMTRDDTTESKKKPGVNGVNKATNGTSPPGSGSKTTTAVVSAMPKPLTEKKMPPPKLENGGMSSLAKLEPAEKKPIVSKVDCSVQTVPVYRIHSSKQNAMKSTKTSSHGTNTLLSTTPRKPLSVEEKSASKPPENVSKPIVSKPASQSPADARENPVAKVVVSLPAPGALDLSTHTRETSSASGIAATKDSKTIFVIAGTKKPQSSNKIQSIVESLAQKRLMSSLPTQSKNGSEASTAPSKSPPTVSKTPAVSKTPSASTNGTFVVPSPVPARSAAATAGCPVSSPLHIETASLGLRYSSAVPPLSGLSRPAPSSTTSSSSSSRPVFPVLPLPQRPKSQSVRSIPNPSLVRQRSADERARDCGKGSPTAGSTATAMSSPSIRDIHSLTRQLQEAGTSVTITNTT